LSSASAIASSVKAGSSGGPWSALGDGRTIERTRYYASGTPQAPLSKEQIEEKFFSCAQRALDKEAATTLFAFLNRLDQQRSLAPLWGLIQRG